MKPVSTHAVGRRLRARSVVAAAALVAVLALLASGFFARAERVVSVGSLYQAPRVPVDGALPVASIVYQSLAPRRALQLSFAPQIYDKAAPGEPYPGAFKHIGIAWRGREMSSINLGRPLAAYFGLVHAHTSASDGRGTVEEAYQYARDVAHLDFFAVTDHPEYWIVDRHSAYERSKAAAREATTERFIGLPGFEYSNVKYGHYVVLNTPDFHSSFDDDDLSDFYDWLKQPAQADALVMFAHPGFHTYRNASEFEHFRFDPALAAKFVGVEVIHWGDYKSYFHGYSGELPYLDEALHLGWKLGVAASQDNHYAEWGTSDTERIGLLLPWLSETEIYRALRERRFYATNNPNLQFAVNIATRRAPGWAPMGTSIKASELPDRTADLRIRYYDPIAYYPMRKFEVIVNGAVVGSYEFRPAKVKRMRAGGEAGEFKVNLPLKTAIWGERLYVYVRLFQGDDGFTESSPIYIDLDRDGS